MTHSKTQDTKSCLHHLHSFGNFASTKTRVLKAVKITTVVKKMATNSEELSKYVTLVSGDGFEFVVLRETACVSGAIKRMLDPRSTPSCPGRQLAIPNNLN